MAIIFAFNNSISTKLHPFMKSRFSFMLIVSMFISNIGFAISIPDSLNRVLQSLPFRDTARVNELTRQAYYYRFNDGTKALKLGLEALSISRSLKFDYGIVYSYNSIGSSWIHKGELQKALNCYLAAAKMKTSKDSMVLRGVALAYNNIGVISQDRKDYVHAYEYYRTALAIDLKQNYLKGISREYGNIGKAMVETGYPDSAFFYLNQCISICKAIHHKMGELEATIDLGRNYALLNESNKSKYCYHLAIKMNNGQYLASDASAYKFLADAYKMEGDIDSALLYQAKAYRLAVNLDDIMLLKESLSDMAALYKMKGDYKSANQYLDSFIVVNNHLADQKTNSLLSDFKERYESEKKQDQIAHLQKSKEKTEYYNTHLIKLRNGLFLTLSFCILLIVVIYKAYRDKRRVNSELMNRFAEVRQKNAEINIKSDEIRKKNDLIVEANTILQRQRQQLSEAQKIAKLGSWEFEPASNNYVWLSYLYELFNLPKTERPPSLNTCIFRIVKSDRPKVIEAIRAAIYERRRTEIDFRIIHLYDDLKYVNAKIVPMVSSSNQLLMISGTLLDTTAHHLTEKKLVYAKEQAEIANRSKGLFLANMSHEIRTPLNGIIGFTDVLMRECTQPTQLEYLNYIRNSGDSLLRLLNDILDFNKIEHGKLEIENIDFQLHETIDLAVRPYKIQAEEMGVQLSLDISPEVPLWINGDPMRTRQLIVNYVSNALKFTTKGAIKIIISVDEINIPAGDQLKLKFMVADTGMGIPSDKQQHIFELFTQADSSTTRKFGGTGLGLAITSQLAKLMGGNTGVVSPGHLGNSLKPGSDFWFTVAVKRANVAAREKKAETKAELNFGGSVKILVAEDNPINQLLMKKVLESMNAQMVIVENGWLAVQQMKDEKFDAVLMDIQMPVMDGYQATMMIRQSISSVIPIIGVSANAFKEDVDRSINAGMDAHLSKPFKPADLFNTIQQLMAKKMSEM